MKKKLLIHGAKRDGYPTLIDYFGGSSEQPTAPPPTAAEKRIILLETRKFELDDLLSSIRNKQSVAGKWNTFTAHRAMCVKSYIVHLLEGKKKMEASYEVARCSIAGPISIVEG